MSKTTLIEQIKGDLGYLKLTRTEEVFAELADQARTSKEDPLEFLAKVVASEVDATRQRRLVGPTALRPLPVSKDPGGVRLRLPALDRSQSHRRPGRARLRA